MVALTIDGLKKALTYIQDNSKTIAYYERSSKRGLIVTDGLSEDEAYHIRVVELLTPKLITQLAESFTALSLAGQELLDILSDDAYLASLSNYLKRQGYSNPSDRQVFRLLTERMTSDPKSWPEMVREIVTDLSQSKAVDVQVEEVEFQDTVQLDAPAPTAEKLIQDAKKKVTK